MLQRLYANFEKLKAEGDKLAEHIERTLRVIVSETLQKNTDIKYLHLLGFYFFFRFSTCYSNPPFFDMQVVC